MLERVRDLIRRRPVVADAAIAVALLAIGIIEQNFQPLSMPADLLALAGATLPFALRTRATFWATVAMYASASILLLQGGVPAAAQVSTLWGLYTLGVVNQPTRKAITLQLLAVTPFLGAIIATAFIESTDQFSVLIVLALFTAVIITSSELTKSRAVALANLEQRAIELETAQRDLLRLAIEDERAAIARELHDVVAHNVSVMVLQSGAAKRILKTQPEKAIEALDAVAESGRQALSEMRLVVGVLRPSNDQGLEPQPVLNRLGQLIARVEEASVPVELEIQGNVTELPVALELSAYRIIQESLTNTMKHAGPGSTARVILDYQPSALRIEITDTGSGPGTAEPAAGHGLVGIHERAAMFHGTVETGHISAGGFRVSVLLPLENLR